MKRIIHNRTVERQADNADVVEYFKQFVGCRINDLMFYGAKITINYKNGKYVLYYDKKNSQYVKESISYAPALDGQVPKT